MTSITLLCVLAACLSLGACGPLHASCKLTWMFPATNCSVVHDCLSYTITNLSGDPQDCKSSEKCLYKLVSDTGSEIHSTHETPVKHYVDDQSFTLSAGSGGAGSCTVAAYSTSETWYAVLDYGTNYCNLRNLVDISKLSGMTDFKEITDDSMCTQYSSHDCSKY
ncbi:uncharacterized protein LOC135348213 [Halichondria panicea]|uniref:uncharacterized protein LOC135348213 n=1 Tax=Halichondria panicea TaxID=6063 RepID=UPI00312B3BB1